MNITVQPPRIAEHSVDPLFLDRWSARSFTDEAMSAPELMAILEAARWAPSAINAQPWRFAWGLRGGVNIWASEKVGIKLQALLLSSVESVGGSLYLGTGGAGARAQITAKGNTSKASGTARATPMPARWRGSPALTSWPYIHAMPTPASAMAAVGDTLPNAFLKDMKVPIDAAAPLYQSGIGKVIVLAFAVILGYGATLAEPAFNVLGQQVEDVTQGAFKKNLFSQAVAIGVGVGAGLGIASLLYGIDLLYLLLPPYALLLILTIINEEKYVNIAWDGGAVTTGPVTVPLKLAIGLSLSGATGAGEGFGVLALASAYPVMNILLLGLYIKLRMPRERVEVG